MLALSTAGILLLVLAGQYGAGHQPCPLCYWQRVPYVLVLLLSCGAVVAARHNNYPLIRNVLLWGGLIFLWSGLLALYHVGVEWQWWQGPQTCARVEDGRNTTVEGLLHALHQGETPPSCAEASWRLWGLSYAGYNMLASALLGVFCFWGAFKNATKKG